MSPEPTSHSRQAELVNEFDDFLRLALPAWRARHGEKYESGGGRARFEARRHWQRMLDDEGWAAIGWPVEFGGRGTNLAETVACNELIAAYRAPMIAGILGVRNVGPAIMAFGTKEQKKHLPAIRSGEQIWVQGFSEPGAGSDLAGLQCCAKLHDATFRISGQKTWTSSAMFADWCQLLVRTGGPGRDRRGISCLLVPIDGQGIDVRPIRQLTGESEFGEVFFSDAPVGSDALLGELGQGWQVAIATLAHERAGTLSQLALLRQVLDEVVDHGRAAHHRGASLDLLTRRRIAGIYEQVSVMGALGERVLGAARDGLPGPEGSIIKLIWSQTNRDLGELRMALLHDEGTAWCAEQDSAADAEARFMFLRSRSSTIAAGTSEVQRNIIAERVLGLPQDPRSSHHDSRRT